MELSFILFLKRLRKMCPHFIPIYNAKFSISKADFPLAKILKQSSQSIYDLINLVKAVKKVFFAKLFSDQSIVKIFGKAAYITF